MKPLIGGENIAILKFRLVHVNVYMACWSGRQWSELHVDVSFAASKKSLNTNKNLLKTSLSAVKFCSNYHRVSWNFARIFTECRIISLKLSRSTVKYRCRSNNRTREISLKRAIDSVKHILNLQLSPTGRTSLFKTFWSELKFLHTFNNNILEL